MRVLGALEVRHPHLSWAVEQAALVLAAVFVYFRVRGLTEASAASARDHARHLVELENALHVDVEAAWQRPLQTSETLEAVGNWIYIWGHWPVLIGTMVWLLWRHRPQFLRLRDAMIVSGALGMLVFVSYPMAPPRLAGLGYVDTVTASSRSYRYLQPPAFVNQYAAMPSLHVGWDLLAGVAVFSATTYLAVRVAACLMPLLMAWAVIATGNHYVLDVVAGVVLVLVGIGVSLLLERGRNRKRAAP